PTCSVLPIEQMCPAAGQGALAIEIREDDDALASALQLLDDAEARVSTTCERAMLEALGGGCQVPIGAYARGAPGRLTLTGVVARPDGASLLREQRSGSDPVSLGNAGAAALLQRGADRILQSVYGECAAVPQQP